MILIITNDKNSFAAYYFCVNHDSFFSRFFDEYKDEKNRIYLKIIAIICNCINVFTVTFYQFNFSLWPKSIAFSFLILIYPKLLNGRVSLLTQKY